MPPIKCMLVTANLGTVYEQMDDLMDGWLDAFVESIQAAKATFVALHVQETGGKNYEEDMDRVFIFNERLTQRLAELKMSSHYIAVDTNFESSDFTALSNYYFVADSIKDHVSMWSFEDNTYVPMPNVCEKGAKPKHVMRQRFPDDMYTMKRWTRKGFQLSRLKLNDSVVDLLNVHLFHDASNLIALNKSPSVFADSRRDALQFVMDAVSRGNTIDAAVKSSGGESNNPGTVSSSAAASTQSSSSSSALVFVFGDFNFRLDMASVVQQIAQDYSCNKSTTVEDGKCRRLVLSDKAGDTVLSVKDSSFSFRDSATFLDDTRYRQFDREPGAGGSGLVELPVTFPPSYAYAETSDKPTEFLSKRCPAWCDRVLMSTKTREVVTSSSSGFSYDTIGRDVCMGDHKPVALTFELPVEP